MMGQSQTFQNFGSGADKITKMVDAINEYEPVGVGMVAFEWIHLIKSNQLVERLKNPKNIKVSHLCRHIFYMKFSPSLLHFEEISLFGIISLSLQVCPQMTLRSQEGEVKDFAALGY